MTPTKNKWSYNGRLGYDKYLGQIVEAHLWGSSQVL